MTKTEIYYIYYKYILGFLSKNLVTAKEANFERNVSISFLLVINKKSPGVLKKSAIILYIKHLKKCTLTNERVHFNQKLPILVFTDYTI